MGKGLYTRIGYAQSRWPASAYNSQCHGVVYLVRGGLGVMVGVGVELTQLGRGLGLVVASCIRVGRRE